MFSQSIEPPEKSSLSGSLIVVLSLAAFVVAVTTPGPRIATAGFFALLMLASFLAGSRQALSLSLFFLALTTSPLVSPLFRNWPYKLLVPLIVYFLVALLVVVRPVKEHTDPDRPRARGLIAVQKTAKGRRSPRLLPRGQPELGNIGRCSCCRHFASSACASSGVSGRGEPRCDG